jgi:hypothetical protein
MKTSTTNQIKNSLMDLIKSFEHEHQCISMNTLLGVLDDKNIITMDELCSLACENLSQSEKINS